MFRNRLRAYLAASATAARTSPGSLVSHVVARYATQLTPRKITELLSANEVYLNHGLPSYVRTIECNQLASNSPIEDRIRVSSITLPNSQEPTLILGVFDGHGGGTTADLVSRRLFNYIAISLQAEYGSESLVDLHNCPQLASNPRLEAVEHQLFQTYEKESNQQSDDKDSPKDSVAATIDHEQQLIASNLKAAFKRCDDDLSAEIQRNLIGSLTLDQEALHHYLTAAVSGCCAIVMVLHQGAAYLASSGDCRAVFGTFDGSQPLSSQPQNVEPHIEHPRTNSFRVLELNDEHNCDNINEIRRLMASHPRSEQNTMIKHNRLLGHLMPFRAFGDFTYKWPSEIIKACGLTRAFGPNVIPASYETPPYLIVEPDVKVIQVQDKQELEQTSRYLVMASDGLWELFESSRDVIESIVDHTLNACVEGNEEDYDSNCATYMLRSALRFGPHQDIGMDVEKMRRFHHIRLESTLTLPKSVVRNFRDDISIILLKLR